MELKKVWMSPDTKKKSKYGYRAVGGILGIVLLMVLLLCGGTLLSLSLGINKNIFSDPSDCCQCSGDRAGRPPGTAVDPGRHDLFSDRK